MQQIVEGDRVIEYFFNSSLYITNINWCINGKQATNPTLFREKIMKNFSTNVLVYTNPSREDRANGLTLYAIEGESDSDCAINTNLITVQSNVGNISARLVLIHIVEGMYNNIDSLKKRNPELTMYECINYNVLCFSIMPSTTSPSKWESSACDR